ncbi:unnamed protein product [Leptidea sinapis]|uniref:Uncharacterized protein n=1 Tax=Leptidea sinapis TaxID=189913 RepID=A0A5E4R6G3_9NEOP|nr:unnamed protein product [Leptidea sinapis]
MWNLINDLSENNLKTVLTPSKLVRFLMSDGLLCEVVAVLAVGFLTSAVRWFRGLLRADFNERFSEIFGRFGSVAVDCRKCRVRNFNMSE